MGIYLKNNNKIGKEDNVGRKIKFIKLSKKVI